MNKFKVKVAAIFIAIALIMLNHSLHLHHTEETKDIILSKIVRLLQYYYGPAIGNDLI